MQEKDVQVCSIEGQQYSELEIGINSEKLLVIRANRL